MWSLPLFYRWKSPHVFFYCNWRPGGPGIGHLVHVKGTIYQTYFWSLKTPLVACVRHVDDWPFALHSGFGINKSINIYFFGPDVRTSQNGESMIGSNGRGALYYLRNACILEPCLTQISGVGISFFFLWRIFVIWRFSFQKHNIV